MGFKLENLRDRKYNPRKDTGDVIERVCGKCLCTDKEVEFSPSEKNICKACKNKRYKANQAAKKKDPHIQRTRKRATGSLSDRLNDY